MKSKMAIQSMAAIFITCLIFITQGCLERKETIVVEPDGTVVLQVVFKGDPDDIRSGDALLNQHDRWSVVDRIQSKDDGTKEMIRTATLTVKPGEKVPEQYCPENSTLSDAALLMPTFVYMKEKQNGIYYYFRRDYKRRDWAFIDYFRQKLVEPELKAIQGKKLRDIPAEKLEKLIRDLVAYEKAKMIEIAWATNESLNSQLDQDSWLTLREGIDDVYNHIDIIGLIKILQMNDQQAHHEIELLTNNISMKIHDVIMQRLSKKDDGSLGRQFVKEFEKQRLRWMISEDIQDESWQVRVQLPGQLIGNNGDYVEGNEVIWEFGGKAIDDRDQILMASSFLAKK